VDGLVLARVAELPDLYVAAADQDAAHRALLEIVREHVAGRRGHHPSTPASYVRRTAATICLGCEEGEHDACMAPCDCTSGYHDGATP
jgi:hypothetical protein